MADSKVRIVIDADADTAVREIKRVDTAMGGMDSATDKAARSHGRLAGVAKAGAVGLAGLAVGAAKFGSDSVKAFTEAEQAMGRAERMLDTNNAGWRKHRDQIDQTIQAHSRLGAFDDEELYVSFANLSRVTGDTTKALEAQQLAMDIARGRGISLEAATKAVEKAYNGNTGALSRLGVEVTKGMSAQDALARAQQQFAGQAEAYGKTTAGQADNIRIAWGNFQEQVGAALIPAVNALMRAFTAAMPVIQRYAQQVVDWIRKHWPQIEEALQETGRALARLWKAAQPLLELYLDALRGVVEWVSDHWETISTVIGAVFKVIETMARVNVAVFRTLLEAWIAVAQGIVAAVQAIAGPVRTAATAVYEAVKTAILAPINFAGWLGQNIVQPITGFLASARERGTAIATNIWAGVTGFATDMAGWITNRIITPIINAYANILERGAGIARNIWAGVTGFVTDMVSWIRNRIIEPITERLPAILSKGQDIAESIWRGLRGFATDMVGYIRERIIEPITDRLAAIVSKGREIADAIADGMRAGANAVKDAVVGAFRVFLNAIIRVINRLPFVDIPLLADGAITRGPQLAMIGEDGPEAVIPLGAKRRKRGIQLLTQAAQMMGVPGDLPAPQAKRMGVRMMADGGIVLSKAYATGASDGAAAGTPSRIGGFTDAVLAGLAELASQGAGVLLRALPAPPSVSGAGGVNSLFGGVREAAASYIRGIFSQSNQWGSAKIALAKEWGTKAVTTGRYLWGGGHGGWDFSLPKGYDCSGFASHAAKMAGSTIGGPGTTGTLLAQARRVAGTSSYPVLWGWRGMDSSNPRAQHMGIRVLGTWLSFGPAIGDSRWDLYGIPPGLPGYQMGVDYVPRTGPAVLHAGEAVLNRDQAADWRAGRGGGLNVIFRDGMGWLRQFMHVEFDAVARDSRVAALAGGTAY